MYHSDLVGAMSWKEREIYQWHGCLDYQELTLGKDEHKAHVIDCPSKPPRPTPTHQSDPFRVVHRTCPLHKADLLEEHIANGITRNDAYDLIDTWIGVEEDGLA